MPRWTRRVAGPRRVVAGLAVGALLATACGGDATTAPSAGASACASGQAREPAGPDPLPVAELSVLGEDATVSTACWVGQPLVLNFWAEWCAPCREEMPDFEQVHRAVGDRVRFVGIDLEDRPQAAIAFAAEVGVTYELVEDPRGEYFRAVRARGTPHTLLVDERGRIRWRHAGPLTRDALERLLAEHLGIEA